MTEKVASGSDPLRVLLVDDSLTTRNALQEMLHSDDRVRIIGHANDGEEALRLALGLRPDCICLDLEMPRMDGFTFLRLLMAKQPTPVVIISSRSNKQDVFRALELGALDFVAKPSPDGGALETIRDELVQKISTVRGLRVRNLAKNWESMAVGTRGVAPPPSAPVGPLVPPVPQPSSPAGWPTVPGEGASPGDALARHVLGRRPYKTIVIGASTGGPAAIGRILTMLPKDLPFAAVIAQHMPEPFTRTFAERLAKTTGFDVRQAEQGDVLCQGRVLVAPGGRHLTLTRPGRVVQAKLVSPLEERRKYCPSVDALFQSAANVLGPSACCVVLTGMGDDGRRGIAAMKQARALTIAESEHSAVVFGMPREAIESGNVDEVLSLDEIVLRLSRFARGT